MSAPLLQVEGLTKHFLRNGRLIAAVADVGFSIAPGETLALVGPSGSGKSTVARLALRLIEPDAGQIRFRGDDWLALGGETLRRARQSMQMVFQDPLAAFNPRATVERVLADPLRVHRIGLRSGRREMIVALLRRVGLDPALASRAIHEISGGQRQRVAIARALATRPALIVLDEALSALDVAVRGAILDLLRDVQKTDGVAYLFIGHDLGVVKAFAPRLAVMEGGRIVEAGVTLDIIENPRSATARALVEAAPRLRKDWME